MPQRESPNQNSHEISQNYKQKKKALNKSMGINYKDYGNIYIVFFRVNKINVNRK